MDLQMPSVYRSVLAEHGIGCSMAGEANSELLQLVHEAKVESVALQQICAALIVEIARLSPDPHAKVTQITAGLQGAGAVIAEAAENIIITQTIETVTELAEIMMSQYPR